MTKIAALAAAALLLAGCSGFTQVFKDREALAKPAALTVQI